MTRFATICAALALALPAARLAAAPIEVAFTPPDVPAREVCVPRPPDHVLTARWQGWDGGAFPGGDRSLALVRRDLRLLRQLDAEAWFDTIETSHEQLARTDPDYGPQDRKFDRIGLLVAAGRLDTLREEGLDDWLLETGVATGGAGAQAMAAEMLWSGEALEQDRDRAVELWRAAAYAGHGGALLEMARLSTEQEIEDWGIEPQIAVTMAFGAMLGDVDQTICDRINRIGSHYRRGDIVAQDLGLAEKWYRLSARLGGSNAAWRVAELHLEGEGVERDVDLMMDHLRQAAEADLPYAMTRLAQILDRGALTGRDAERARELYDEAARHGSETALIRLVGMARAEDDGSPEARARIRDSLERLLDRADPPAWAYMQLGDIVLAEQGRWAGEDRAAELYRKALEADPTQSAARIRLARIEMRAARTPQAFEDVTADLRRAVRADGLTEPMQDLGNAYRCRAPAAPNETDAAFWKRMEVFSGDTTIELTEAELRGLSADETPVLLAHLQSQAINARSRSTANYLQAAQTSTVAGRPETLRGLALRDGSQLNLAEAKVDRRLGRRDAAEAHLRDALAAREPGAAMALIELLREDGIAGPEERQEIVSLAEPLAEAGRGAAIETLIAVDPDLDAATAWDRYAAAIDRNGDFPALLFALHHLEDAERRDDYANRARTIMGCDASDALALAAVSSESGNGDAARHWVRVAEAAVQRPDWELVAVADAILERGLSEAPLEDATALYRRSADAGYVLGMRRLLDLRQDGRIEMPVAEASDLYVRLAESGETDKVVSALGMLAHADPAVQEEVNARIDARALYAQAAEQGDPDAQVEMARIIRAEAEGPDALTGYADLLTRAAEQGNAEAMLLLSRAYAYGVGAEPSPEQSRRWLRRAAEAGNAEAQETARMLTTEKGQTE